MACAIQPGKKPDMNTSTRMKDVSVIIVCHRGWKRLLKCLESLRIFGGNHFSMEVIVVDNNSPDGMINEIEKGFPGFRFIKNSVNGGFANGCNLGANAAEGKYLLFLNPDTVILEKEAEKLLAAAQQNPDCTVLSCRQVSDKGKEGRPYGQFPSIKNITGIQRSLSGDSGKEIPEDAQSNIFYPDWVSGSVILISKKEFQSIGGFDEDFWMYFEDVDLCRRIHYSGGSVAFLRDATIEHNHGGSSRVNMKTSSITKTEVMISEHVYVSKHIKGVEKILMQVMLVVINLISGFILALAGIVLFFIPRLFVKTLVFGRLSGYYLGALFRQGWISPRSVNFSS